jgi:hypothetical protein
MTKISSKNTKFPLIFPHKIYKNPSQFIQKWPHGLLSKYTKKSPNITKKTSKMPQGDNFGNIIILKEDLFVFFGGSYVYVLEGKPVGRFLYYLARFFVFFEEKKSGRNFEIFNF